MSKNETLLLIAATVGVAVVLLRRIFRRRREAERRTAEQENQREVERFAAVETARREAERREAEEEARREAERLAAEELARREAERREAEEEAQREAERLAAAEAARREAERREAEEEAQREAERLVAAEMARREAERLAAEEEARREAERLAAAETARREAAQIAADEARRQEAENAQRRVREAVEPTPEVTAKSPEQTVVMVADDSKVVRVKTSRLLTAHKYQVLTAEDGLDAARQIENSLPDVLITDVDMPGLDGFQLVRQLRSNPRTASIPIIMVTSDNDVLRSEAVASGVDVVLGKPYPEEQLIAHIQKLVIDAKGD